MPPILGPAIAFVVLSAAVAPQRSGVQVTPVFWRGQDKPDGALHEQVGIAGSFLGTSMEVPAGTTYVELFVLGDGSTIPLDLAAIDGAYVMTPWDVPVKVGERRIAFRCGSEWSGEIPFVWDIP